MKFKFINLEPIPEGFNIPVKVDKWYNRQQRSWVIQLKDRYDNQIGEAIYVYTKEEAEKEVNRLINEHNL